MLAIHSTRIIVLKTFLNILHFVIHQEKMQQYQDSAGFYFYAEFFVYGWGPTNPEEDMMLTRYRRATKPHWECTKYVILPSRVVSITTHSIFPISHYST